ncbi:MAG: radical SAM protein [Terriglobales bacterium]
MENGAFIYYAPLRRTAWIGNASIARLIERLRKSQVWSFTPKEAEVVTFLQDVGVLGGQSDVPPRFESSRSLKPTRASLLLTTACTLRCRYCYAAAGEQPAVHMSLDTATRGIDFIIANAVELGAPAIELSFHGGGEPTANWPVLTGSVQYARHRAQQHGLALKAYMSTNAVLDVSRVEWIGANLNGLTVSLDGLPAVHDANRCLPDGGPSSHRVLRTLRLLDERRFPYGVRATVTTEAIAYLPESVEFIFTTSRPASVQVEPVYRFGRGQTAATAETEEFIEAFREARQRARNLGGDLTFSPVRIGSLTDHFCEATKGSFCLSTSGNVTSCYEVFSEDQPWAAKFFFGKPAAEGGYDYDERVLSELRSQSVHNRSYCRDCFVKWDCGGDCYHKALITNGDAEFQGSGRCHIVRELSKDVLLDRIASSGGVFWREGAPPGADPMPRKERDDAADM